MDREQPSDAGAESIDDALVYAKLAERMLGDPASPLRVGRFVVLRRLGQGAMGAVYVAYDAELDRQVALKLLHRRVADDGSAGRERILREAHALAKLSHPNVVTVHEVGEHGGRVFLAMELVVGTTLRERWHGTARDWREVLANGVEIGKGVAAAHKVGLVHRDLKPDNVLVGDDGRLRVVDFGLARMHGDVGSTDGTSGESGRSAELTATGSLVGTPAYMAPEQLAGAAADAQSDQFAICVVLWEGLFGARPFVGESIAELARAMREGEPRGSSRRVPSWLRSVLVRGLAHDRRQRWPTLDLLVAELERGQARARRRWLGIGALALLGAGIGGVALVHADELRRRAHCEELGAAIAEVWNDDIAQRVTAAVVATQVPGADQLAAKLVPLVAAQADAWRSARASTCIADDVEHTWDAETHTRALACLELARLDLDALIDSILVADRTAVHRATEAAYTLVPIGPCVDVDRLRRTPAPADELRDAVQPVRANLVRARVLVRAGELEAARSRVDAARSDADALGWAPLSAETLLALGELQLLLGELEAAERALVDAYFLAMNAGAAEIGTDAATLLVRVVGDELSRPGDGFVWARHADVALGQLDEPEGGRATALSMARARLHRGRGELDEAEALERRVIALREAALGEDHPLVATSLDALAVTLLERGAHAEALAAAERSLAIRERIFGPDHPAVADALQGMADLLSSIGEPKRARSYAERAVAISERVYGPEHTLTAGSLAALANVLLQLGELAEARALHERTLAIVTATVGPDHPDAAVALLNLSSDHYFAGDYAGAKVLLERALAIQTAALGETNDIISSTRNNLATMNIMLGDHAAARGLLERVLLDRERTLGSDNLKLTGVLVNLAEVHRVLGLPGAGRPLLERALAIREANGETENADYANDLANLAAYDVDAGETAAARPRYERALAIWERELGPDHVACAYAWVGLARVALAEHRAEDALTAARRAVLLRDRGPSHPSDAAEARFLLAQTLWPTEPRRARDLALRSLDEQREHAADPGDVERIERWLASHR